MGLIEIIGNLTGFLLYFVPGYIFLTVYYCMAIKSRESSTAYLVIKSVTASYVLNELSQFTGITWTSMGKYYVVLLILMAAAAGVLFGWLRKWNLLADVLVKLFGRNFYDNYLFELWKKSRRKENKNKCTVVYLRRLNEEFVVAGQLVGVSEYYEKEPLITLKYYSTFKNGIKVSDHSNDEREFSIRYTPEWIIEPLFY